jgi:hypothetical protein
MWEFHSSYSGGNQDWSWQNFHQGRLRRQSGPGFNTVREAIADANLHGFEAHIDRWSIYAATSTFRQPSRLAARGAASLPRRSAAPAVPMKSDK